MPFEPGKAKLPSFPQAQAFWYQWLLCTTPGARSLCEDPVAFGKALWDAWSPSGWYTEAEFAEAAKSWKGKDFPDVVLHGYRSRWGHAEPDPRYDVLQARFEATVQLHTPTLHIHGMVDRCALVETTDGAHRHFTAGYKRVLLDGVGHFPQRENAKGTSAAILEHLRDHA